MYYRKNLKGKKLNQDRHLFLSHVLRSGVEVGSQSLCPAIPRFLVGGRALCPGWQVGVLPASGPSRPQAGEGRPETSGPDEGERADGHGRHLAASFLQVIFFER